MTTFNSNSVPKSPNLTSENSQSGVWPRVSLGIKLPLIVIILLLLAFLVSTFLSVQITQTALIDALKGELTAQSASKAELIRSNLIWTRGVAIDLAAAAEVANYDQNTILNTIDNTLARNDQIFGSTIAYEPYQFQPGIYYWSPYYSRTPNNKELKFTQLGNPEYDYFHWDWYTLPKEKGAPVLSPPYYDFGGGEIWMVTWSAPFFDNETGKFKGVATADIAFSQTQEIVNNISVGQNGYAFLLDSHGTILGIGRNGGNYTTMVDTMTNPSSSPEAINWNNLISAMRNGKSGFVETINPRGLPVFVAYTPVGLDTGWSLALAYPQEELLQTPLRLRNNLIIYSSLVMVIFAIILYLFTRSITRPIQSLTQYASQFSMEKLSLTKGQPVEQIKMQTRDELEDLAAAFNSMSTNLTNTFETLEEKVADRTSELERRSIELETSAEVAREITIIRDLDTLLNVAVNLIRERFGYYHVGIFLVDENGEFAYLRAASSSAAQQMLEQNYKLKVGQEGLVGNVTRTGKAYIVRDVNKDSTHIQNPFLPQTQSEITLPLRSRNITIGALDIQNNKESAFDERDINILQLLADQLAAAIENAQLDQQVKRTFTELNNAYRLQTKSVWQSTINKRENSAYEYDGMRIQAVPQNLPDNLLKQLENGRPVITKADNLAGTKNTLLIPLTIRSQMIGVIGMEHDDPNRIWTEEEISIAEAAANRAGITMENARLLEDSQKRAAKERAIFEATTRIGSALNMENILHATVEELEKIMGDSEVTLQFNNDNAPSANEK